MRRERRRLAAIFFALSSLVAVGAGCIVAGAHGVAPAHWLPDPLAWLVGGLVAVAMGWTSARPLAWAALGIGVVALGISLASPGLDGVHRWIGAGALRINAAQLVAPALLVGAATLRGAAAFAALAFVALALAAQPDASQAVALAAGGIAGLSLPRLRQASGLALTAVLAGAAVIATRRVDPLAPVPEVEGIMRLAGEMSLRFFGTAVTALTLAVISPAGVGTRAGWALTAYFGVTVLAPIVGAYPVPWMGLGVSSILGAWLGFGLLVASARQAPSPALDTRTFPAP